MDNQPVQVEKSAGVAVVTINRPQVRNAIDADTTHQLEVSFDELEADAGVSAIVLTGAGAESFSAGMDLKAFAAHGPRGLYTKRGGFAGITRRKIVKPTIAAVNGSAFGGGLELALTCDLIVAATHAQFGLPEVKRGLIAGAGGLIRLPRRVPLSIALEMTMTGQPVTAERALSLGLINGVCDGPELLARATDLAGLVAENAPMAVTLSRGVLRDSLEMTEAAAWVASDEALNAVMSSEDAKEGPRAFAERRAPKWVGR